MQIRTKILYPVFATVCFGLFASSAFAQSKVAVKFPRGSHNTSKKGTVKGYAYIDYLLGARAGQQMMVELSSLNDKAQFVVLDPDKQNVEFGTGEVEYSGEIQKSGNYTVRVLMSRADARRKGASTTFVITFTIQ